MFCNNCGKEIDDNSAICPHCGVPVNAQNNNNYNNNNYNNNYYQPAYQPAPQTDSNPVAIVGFILSFLGGIAGLICSIIGYNKAKKEGAPHKGLALAGIIISAVVMGLGVLLYIIMIAAGIGIGLY